MSKNRKVILAVLLVVFAVAASYGGMFLAFVNRSQAPPEPVVVVVKPGMAFGTVAAELHAQNVVSDVNLFRILGRLKGVENAIQAGEYDFRVPATPGTILDRLVAGDVRRYKLTVPEGFNLAEIATRIDEAGLADTAEFMNLATDPDFIASLGVEAETLEGYLFPETYTYVAGTSLETLLTSMVEQFRTRLTPEIGAAASEQGFDVHELVTFASIVQKEAGNNEEMPLIAAVFHNRLQRNIPLQADPTVIYGLGSDFDGNLTRRHLRMPTPYNTYTMIGLPPGPIASPGTKALQSVAFPADVEYLYFVAKGDGTHTFSHTLKEHNRAVRKYQLKQP